MFRGPILCAALIGSGNAQQTCAGRDGAGGWRDDCIVNMAALAEFTTDYDLVLATSPGPWQPVTTMPLPPQAPSDHGTIAVHARSLQVKLDNHFAVPVAFGNQPGHPQPILAQLAGHEIHEELHINGLHGQASFHLGSPILNACIQVDVPTPPPSSMSNIHEQIDRALEHAGSTVNAEFHNRGHHVTVDNEPGFALPSSRHFPGHAIFILTEDSHPEMVVLGEAAPDQWLGLKFSNYVNSVGNAFAVRACEVETHSATQTMLAENPEVREFIAQRLAEHQRRLQALLEPTSLKTRFNFVPLHVAELLMPPVREGCTNVALAETAPMAASTFQILVSVCSFVMGSAATYGAMRKKAAPSADAYYHVSA